MNLLPESAGVPPACCNRDIADETPALPGFHRQAPTYFRFFSLSLVTSTLRSAATPVLRSGPATEDGEGRVGCCKNQIRLQLPR